MIISVKLNGAGSGDYGLEVVSDQLSNHQGPLAGFASDMGAVDSQYILTLRCDSRLLSDQFVARFIECHNLPENKSAPISVADDGERLQPVHALVDVDLLANLNAFLDSGERKIDRWYAQHRFNRVDFSDQREIFKNINTPEDQQNLALDKLGK